MPLGRNPNPTLGIQAAIHRALLRKPSTWGTPDSNDKSTPAPWKQTMPSRAMKSPQGGRNLLCTRGHAHFLQAAKDTIPHGDPYPEPHFDDSPMGTSAQNQDISPAMPRGCNPNPQVVWQSLVPGRSSHIPRYGRSLSQKTGHHRRPRTNQALWNCEIPRVEANSMPP